MSKPASYPFLAIAKRYGVDYGDVLQYAEWMLRPRRANSVLPRGFYTLSPFVKDDVAAANHEQQAIRDGKLDWQTGEPTEMDYGDGVTRY